MCRPKKQRRKTYDPNRYKTKTPSLLNKLPMTDGVVRLINDRYSRILLRFGFGTWNRDDITALYVFFAIAFDLAKKMNEADSLSKIFEEAQHTLQTGWRAKAFAADEFDALGAAKEIAVKVWAVSHWEDVLELQKNWDRRVDAPDLNMLFPTGGDEPEETDRQEQSR